MKILLVDSSEFEIPDEVAAAAKLVGDWFEANGYRYWQFKNVCSRRYAYAVERVAAILTAPEFKDDTTP